MATAVASETFIGKVVKRRQNLFDLTDEAARVIARQLDAARVKALRDAKKKLRDTAVTEGDIAAAKKKATAVAADITDAFNSGLAKAKNKLESASKTALRLGLLDAMHTVEAATGEKATLGGTFSQIFRQAVKESARSEVLGVPRDEALDGARDYVETRVREIVTNAFINGEPVEKTANQIDEATGIGQRSAMRTARTNLIASANQGHMAVYRENDDILLGYQWHSTFDQRTSTICASLHGKFWPIDETPPGPPAHPNCRSVLLPVFKDAEVQDEVESQETQRVKGSSGEAIVAADVGYDVWLKKQDDDFKADICGSVVKADLFSANKLSLDDLVWPDLSVRTDEEALQLALARHPDDQKVKKIAEDVYGKPLPKASLRTIKREEKTIEKTVPFDQGT